MSVTSLFFKFQTALGEPRKKVQFHLLSFKYFAKTKYEFEGRTLYSNYCKSHAPTLFKSTFER